MYWAKALAGQDKDAALKAHFAGVAEAMISGEATIVEELRSVQGPAMDIGGYYKPDAARASAAMRPSATLNAIVDGI